MGSAYLVSRVFSGFGEAEKEGSRLESKGREGGKARGGEAEFVGRRHWRVCWDSLSPVEGPGLGGKSPPPWLAKALPSQTGEPQSLTLLPPSLPSFRPSFNPPILPFSILPSFFQSVLTFFNLSFLLSFPPFFLTSFNPPIHPSSFLPSFPPSFPPLSFTSFNPSFLPSLPPSLYYPLLLSILLSILPSSPSFPPSFPARPGLEPVTDGGALGDSEARRLLAALLKEYVQMTAAQELQQQQQEAAQEGGPSLDRPLAKRCANLSTCVLGKLSQELHKLHTYPRTDVGAGTPGKKRNVLSELQSQRLAKYQQEEALDAASAGDI